MIFQIQNSASFCPTPAHFADSSKPALMLEGLAFGDQGLQEFRGWLMTSFIMIYFKMINNNGPNSLEHVRSRVILHWRSRPRHCAIQGATLEGSPKSIQLGVERSMLLHMSGGCCYLLSGIGVQGLKTRRTGVLGV